MFKEKLISNYQIFFDLRNLYPEFTELIGEIMHYAFSHQDSFYETTYLNGTFDEDDVQFIFKKLDLHLKVVNVIKTNHRPIPQTIVKLNIKSSKLAC